MKARSVYLVGPLVLLAGFVGYFVPANARIEAVLSARRAVEAERAAAEEIARAQRERDAEQRHQERVREREQEEAARRARRDEEQLARETALRAALDEARAERAIVRGKVEMLETRHAGVVAERQSVEAALWAERQETERRRIERRTLDLQMQRAAEVLAERVAPGVLSTEPVFPAPFPDAS